MKRFRDRVFRHRVDSRGLPPGTVLDTGGRGSERVVITVFDYDAERCDKYVLPDAGAVADYRDRPTVTWINVDGVHDANALMAFGNLFSLHPLVLEDIAHTGQRPKCEDYGDYLYLVIKMIRYDTEARQIDAEQVSIVLGRGVVLSFQEHRGDVFDAVRERLRLDKGRIRRQGADYLAYSLMDAVVDEYFVILEELGADIEELEDEVLEKVQPQAGRMLRQLRNETILLRRPVWPLRETISILQRSESPLLSNDLNPFLADLYDHTIQVADGVDSLREMVAGLRDTYLATISNRMNEIMKVLTTISTTFIPLAFITGVYGMNFKHMPELQCVWGYPAALGAMALVAGGMLLYFKKKRWI